MADRRPGSPAPRAGGDRPCRQLAEAIEHRGIGDVAADHGPQFVDDKSRALAEIRRILAPAGRLVLNLPGPTPDLFAQLADALSRHIDPRCAGFVEAVFSLHDSDRLRELVAGAGFDHVDVDRERKTFALPEDFLWQYIHSTPLAGLVQNATDEQRAALAAEVSQRWSAFVAGKALALEVGVTTVRAS